MQPAPPQPNRQFWLTSQDGVRYLFLATLTRHDPRTAVLLIECVRSEAIQKGTGTAEPQPLNREPYAEVELTAHGEAHFRFGKQIPLANGTDRDGIIWCEDAEAFVNHLHLLQWLYGLWGKLLPNVRGRLPSIVPEAEPATATRRTS